MSTETKTFKTLVKSEFYFDLSGCVVNIIKIKEEKGINVYISSEKKWKERDEYLLVRHVASRKEKPYVIQNNCLQQPPFTSNNRKEQGIIILTNPQQ